MSLLNLKFGLLIYEGSCEDTQPKVRTPDITKDYQAISVSSAKSDEAVLQPGETTTLTTTVRSTDQDNTTEFAISYPKTSEAVARLTWTGTGTSPTFRSRRTVGVDATSVFSITRVSPNTVRLSSTGGTAINTSAVVIGDTLKFERSTDSFTSVFSLVNQGKYFRIQAKTSSSIDFLDNGEASLDAAVTLGAQFDQQFRVFSQSPVKVGDTVEITGSLNAGNLGQFKISDLSSDYVEYVNAFAVAETFTNSNNVTLYDRLIGFLLARAHSQFSLSFNNNSAFSVKRLSQEALFMGSVEAHTIEATNNGLETVTISFQHATVL